MISKMNTQPMNRNIVSIVEATVLASSLLFLVRISIYTVTSAVVSDARKAPDKLIIKSLDRKYISVSSVAP